MKKLLVIFFLISTTCSFADAGNGYRIYLQMASKNSDTINGYIYHYTYEEISNRYELINKGLNKYIKNDTISLYSLIATVSLGEINVDFTTDKYKKKVALKDYDRIFIMEFLDFGPVNRLFELKENEFKLIELNPPMFEKLYNENVAENCWYILMSWDEKPNLSKFADELNEKLVIYGKDVIKNQYQFHDYLNLKKDEYLQNNILLINYCVPL